MRRRDFNLAALSAFGLAASGCTLPKADIEKIAAACANTSRKNDYLTIDMHCHLMNLNDSDGAAFFNRRYTNKAFRPNTEQSSRVNRFLDRATQIAFRLADGATSLYTHTLDAETKYLENLPKDTSFSEFCRETSARERALFHSNDADGADVPPGQGRLTGFASHRLRNASYMMAAWPEVDIFTPSMVDFYEGRIGSRPWREVDPDKRDGKHNREYGAHKQEYGTTPTAQAVFYRELHKATRGRFLPLVSFHPERQMDEVRAEQQLSRRDLEERRKTQLTPLALVRKAVESWGFIGVKVHPSSGFDPLDNAKYGCSNTRYQWQPGLSNLEEIGYQKAMNDLYSLCAELDVPILTHASDGLAANPNCMQHNPDPLEWTGSPAHWIQAVDRQTGPDVCLAHFASRFTDHIKQRDGGYEGQTFQQEYDAQDRELQPSKWLQAAVDDIVNRKSKSRMWLDLSHMPALVYSQASRAMANSPPPTYEYDEGRYAEMFGMFLQHNPHLVSRIMYGTDAHMPAVSMVGPRYLSLMEAVIKNASVPGYPNALQDIMGRNAVKFFGLANGGSNRKRLEAFYRDEGIKNVTWMKRVDES